MSYLKWHGHVQTMGYKQILNIGQGPGEDEEEERELGV